MRKTKDGEDKNGIGPGFAFHSCQITACAVYMSFSRSKFEVKKTMIPKHTFQETFFPSTGPRVNCLQFLNFSVLLMFPGECMNAWILKTPLN